jgi:hypothetical protein
MKYLVGNTNVLFTARSFYPYDDNLLQNIMESHYRSRNIMWAVINSFINARKGCLSLDVLVAVDYTASVPDRIIFRSIPLLSYSPGWCGNFSVSAVRRVIKTPYSTSDIRRWMEELMIDVTCLSYFFLAYLKLTVTSLTSGGRSVGKVR